MRFPIAPLAGTGTPVTEPTPQITATITGTIGDDLFAAVTGGGVFALSDPGGNDRISAAGLYVSTTIDLRAGGTSLLGDTTYILQPGTVIEYGIGASIHDHIFGNDVANFLHSDAGNDTIQGFAGDDTIHAGDGWDYVFGGDGNDIIRFGFYGGNVASGDAGDDTIYGSVSDDEFLGGLGNDLIFGGDGRDTVYGGEGDDIIRDLDTTIYTTNIDRYTSDRLEGGYGDDFIFGGLGNDLLAGQEGADTVLGGAGADTIFGGDQNDSLQGGTGQDILWGGLGDDNLAGNADNDLIYGGAGDDFINPGQGADTIWGGTGADHFYSSTNSPTPGLDGVNGADRVMDYDAAQGDLLVLGQENHRGTIELYASFANSGLGDSATAEAFIWDAQTSTLLWIIADGAAMDTINVWNGGLIYDIVYDTIT